MIRVFSLVSGRAFDIELPYAAGFSLAAERPHAKRRALAGNMIHQTEEKDQSGLAGSYSQSIPNSQADEIEALDFAASSAFMTFQGSVYQVVLDVRPSTTERDDRRKISVTFNVVRKIL